jgi:hypothetical protein
MMRLRTVRRRSISGVLPVVLLLLSGCAGLTTAQKEAVGGFGRASTSFGNAVSTEMIEVRNIVIDLNTQALSLAPAMIKDRDQLDAAFTLPRVGARIRAANVIQTYGDLLVALVEDTQTREVQAAAGKFTNSVRGLDPDRTRLSDADLEAVGKVVAAIGGLVVEHKKAEALKTIVPKAHPQIETLGQLFASEFDPKSGAVAMNFDATAQRALRASETVLDKGGSTVGDRVLAATAHRRGIEASRKANAVFPELQEGALAMVKAHASLVDALAKDRVQIADIKNFAKTVENLAASVRILSNR